MNQLPLPVGLSDRALFDNFVDGRNQAARVAVQSHVLAPTVPLIWLWGASGSGKTHLLRAACALKSDADAATYLPLTGQGAGDPAAMDDLGHQRLVCLDDIDEVAGSDGWERALFALFNALNDHGGSLLVSAACAPRHVPFGLADLQSRLASGPVFQLMPLSDTERIDALRMRAAQRGLTLSDEVGEYLLRNFRRDMLTLYRLLDRLDSASLAAQRRLTVPFVRQALKNDRTRVS